MGSKYVAKGLEYTGLSIKNTPLTKCAQNRQILLFFSTFVMNDFNRNIEQVSKNKIF